MATVIDALLVTLGLDSKDFGKGINEAKNAQKSLSDQLKRESKERGQIDSKAAQAQKKRVDEIHAQAKRTAEGFRKIRNEALAMAAVFAGGMGLAEFAKFTVDSAANLGLMSQGMGVSIRQIAGLRGAIQTQGGSAGQADALLESITQQQGYHAATGILAPGMHMYQAYGGDLTHGQLTDPMKYMMGVAALLQRERKTHSAEEVQSIAAQIGFTGPAYYLLMNGPKAAAALIDKMGTLSGVTERTARAAQRLREQMVILWDRLKQVGTELMLSLTPELQKAIGVLQRLASWIHGHQKDIDSFFQAVTKDIEYAAAEANKLAQKMGGWRNVLIALIAIKVASWLTPIATAFGLLAAAIVGNPEIAIAIAAITGLVAGLAWLYNNNPTFKKIVDTATPNSPEQKAFLQKGSEIEQGIITGETFRDWYDWLIGNKSSTTTKAPIVDVAHAHGPPPGPLNAANMVKGMARRSSVQTVHNNTSSSQINLGTITINTQATDAHGIAKSIKHPLTHVLHQINSGEH
ncbi:MAG TPA: hypothetical protein VFL97_00695 [Nitrococcus sp.]|nr:hypothetical protein [Nitrococcus sp.]